MMNDQSLYLNEAERERHHRNIEAMARELQLPVEEIALFYEDALVGLAAQAQVRDYLPILVGRKVRKVLGGFSRAD